MATPNFKGGLTAVTPKTFASLQLAAGANTIYTVGASKAAKIDSPLVLCNTSPTSVVISVAVIPAGGAVDGTHRVISSYSLAAGDTLSVDEVKGWLGAGDFISVSAGTGAAVNAVLRGLEFS